MRSKNRSYFLLHGFLSVQSIERRKNMRSQSRPLWKLSLIACSVVLAVKALVGAAIAQPTPSPTWLRLSTRLRLIRFQASTSSSSNRTLLRKPFGPHRRGLGRSAGRSDTRIVRR